MSDTQIQDGKTMAVSGIAASKVAGEIYGVLGWVGPVIAHIRGTGDDYNTSAVKGFPLADGAGDGKGDIALEGVWAFPIVNAAQAGAAVGDPVFWDGTNLYVDATNTGMLVGHIYPQDDEAATRALAADDAECLQNAGQTHVVYVKLFGRPKALA